MFKISGCSVKSLNDISPFITRKRYHKVPLITKPEYIRNQVSTISAHMNPYNLYIQLSAKSYKIALEKGQRITYILSRPCIFFRLI